MLFATTNFVEQNAYVWTKILPEQRSACSVHFPCLQVLQVMTGIHRILREGHQHPGQAIHFAEATGGNKHKVPKLLISLLSFQILVVSNLKHFVFYFPFFRLSYVLNYVTNGCISEVTIRPS